MLGCGGRATSCWFLTFALKQFGRLLIFILIGGIELKTSGGTRLLLDLRDELLGSGKGNRVVDVGVDPDQLVVRCAVHLLDLKWATARRRADLARATTGSLSWSGLTIVGQVAKKQLLGTLATVEGA